MGKIASLGPRGFPCDRLGGHPCNRLIGWLLDSRVLLLLVLGADVPPDALRRLLWGS